MTAHFNLQATPHRSQVLGDWIASRPGAAERAGLRAQSYAGDSGIHTSWGGVDWSEWVRGGMSGSVAVNESTARSISAVVACTGLIGGSIASLPFHFYRKANGVRERVTGGVGERLWWLFNERPHHAWSAAAFWQYLSDSRLLHGDAFARIRRGDAIRTGGEPVAFEPIHPGCVEVDEAPDDGRLLYTIWSDAAHAGRPEVVESSDMLHIPGPGFDGKRSMSQLRYALMHPAGIAWEADRQAAAVMADGARPDFAIEVPGNMDEAQRDALRKSWNDRHSGRGSKKAPVVLAGGMKLHQLTLSSEDAQLLTTRAFQVEEICRIFGVPPHMVGHTDKATSWGSGIEQQAMGFVTYTLQRHLVAFEQEINHKLFARPQVFAEFVTAGLLRGDTKTRFEAYRIALGRAGEPAWMKPGEVRALENMPPAPELDEPATPAQPMEGTP